MQKVEVEEKVEVRERRFTATFTLTNSDKVAFSRRDLALCFYPQKVVTKADRNYEVITVDGKVVPLDNQRLVNRLWQIVQQSYIYNGTVKKANRYAFDWHKIVRRLCKDYQLESFRLFPERGGNKAVTEIKITTDTADYTTHVDTIERIYNCIRNKASHLRLEKSCYYNIAGPCPTDFEFPLLDEGIKA